MVAPAGVVLSECVTELYLERCAEDAIRFDRMDHLFFRPLLVRITLPKSNTTASAQVYPTDETTY